MKNSENASSGVHQFSEASSTEAIAKSDREIVEGVWNEIDGTDSVWDGEGIDVVGEDMKLAEALSGKLFGSITSEEEAKEKGRAAIIELNGVPVEERTYEAKFFEKYDAWMVNGTLPPGGIDEQGRPYAVPGSVPYVIMRSSNGKVLAFGIF